MDSKFLEQLQKIREASKLRQQEAEDANVITNIPTDVPSLEAEKEKLEKIKAIRANSPAVQSDSVEDMVSLGGILPPKPPMDTPLPEGNEQPVDVGQEEIVGPPQPIDQEDIADLSVTPTEPTDQEGIAEIPQPTNITQPVTPKSTPQVDTKPSAEGDAPLTKNQIYQDMFDKYKAYREKLQQQADAKRKMSGIAGIGTALTQAGADIAAGSVGEKARQINGVSDQLAKEASAMEGEALDIEKMEISMDAKRKLQQLEKQGFDIKQTSDGGIYAISKDQVDENGKPVTKVLKSPVKRTKTESPLAQELLRMKIEKLKADTDRSKSYARYKDFQISEDVERDRTAIQKEVKKHPLWKRSQDYKAEIAGLDGLLEQARKGGKNGATALKTLGVKLAKAFGEKGALSESDVTRYISSAGVLNFVKSKKDEWTSGKLSDGAYQSIKNVLSNVKKAQKDNLEQAYHQSAIDFKRSRKQPMTYAEARYFVDPNYTEPKNIDKNDQDALDWVINNPNAKQTPSIIAKLKKKGLL